MVYCKLFELSNPKPIRFGRFTATIGVNRLFDDWLPKEVPGNQPIFLSILLPILFSGIGSFIEFTLLFTRNLNNQMNFQTNFIN